ncbi:MAG: universal stress protein [Ferruginibacter sp.]
MKTVIVPVDFSANSANAALFAGGLATFYGASLCLYHVYELPAAIGDFSYPVFDAAEMQAAAEHDMDLFRQQVEGQLNATLKISTRTELNTLQEGLEALCKETKAELVVMGLSGRGTLTRLIVGSNTIRTIYNLTCPVLVVPPGAAFSPVQKIGFACDYKEIVKNTPLDLLKQVVKDFNAELHVLNVDYHNRNFSPEMIQESFDIGEILKDIKPEYHNIDSEDVTEGINWLADRRKLDIIVVVPKKHQLVQRIFQRSHTKDLLFHTHIPVLCMHQ